VIAGLSVLGLITARGGSKGVPGKNIVQVGGKPLLQWTIDAALQSRYLDRLILSSDDAAIMDAARAGGCDVPFQRAPELSGDAASSIDVVVDALERVAGFDVVVLLQPTSPLRLAEDIDGALEALETRNAPVCVSVRPADDHPYLVFRTDDGSRLEPYARPAAGQSLRRQDLPPAWCLNGAVFAARVDWFLRERTFLSPQTIGYPMPPDRSLDIDTPADIALFASLVQRLPSQQPYSDAVTHTG
jgi:N-acylneuraminate cytidylyltransferase